MIQSVRQTRFYRALVLGTLGLGLGLGGANAATPATAPAARLTALPGWVIYSPGQESYGYRYGPALIQNPDGSLDAWFASPGGPAADGTGEWDWIRHRRSPDGGSHWGPETVVLRPTMGSRDRFSVCDPAVVRLGDWYYLGVTSVDNQPGNRNCVYVARSHAPTGPFEKWNGHGWGGAPAPLIEFTTPTEAWGAGEPSFVVQDSTLYVYYTWWVNKNPDGPLCNQTRVATAPAGDPDWPARLRLRGVAFDRVADEDSADVKYSDELKLFLSVSTASRMGPDAHLVYRTSGDGLHFGPPTKLSQNVKTWCHNSGLAGTPVGHIPAGMRPLLGYAYSDEPKINWGHWHTLLQPVQIERGP